MAETLHPDPWRARGDYDEDRRRMKYMMFASVVSSIGAVISSVAALIAVFGTHACRPGVLLLPGGLIYAQMGMAILVGTASHRGKRGPATKTTSPQARLSRSAWLASTKPTGNGRRQIMG